MKTWFFAEDLLREANNWVFIGYSLPEADFEFKYLLKRIELSRLKPPRLFLIDPSKKTALRYKAFFGTTMPEKAIYLGDLGREAVEHLVKHGVPMTKS